MVYHSANSPGIYRRQLTIQLIIGELIINKSDIFKANIYYKNSLNSNFANVQIDLDNLAQVLGSTSIQVTLPPKCNSPATSGGGRASTPTTTVAQQPVDDVYH